MPYNNDIITKRIIKKRAAQSLQDKPPEEVLGISKNNILSNIGLQKVTLELVPSDLGNCLLFKSYSNYCSLKSEIPNTKQLFQEIESNTQLPPLMTIDEFRKQLLKHGYYWTQFSGEMAKPQWKVVEKPLIRFERHEYLDKIARCRGSNMIFFLDEIAFDSRGCCLDFESSEKFTKRYNIATQQRFVFAGGAAGIISLEKVEVFSEKVFHDWISDLCQSVDKPSVFVIRNLAHHNKKTIPIPTLFSSRDDMKEWLNFKKIPFSLQSSKYDLYDLIQKCTNPHENTYKLDTLVEAYGHTLLRIPRSLEYMLPSSKFIDESLTLFKPYAKRNGIKLENKKVCLDYVYTEFIHQSFNANFGKYVASMTKEEMTILGVGMKIDQMINNPVLKNSNLNTQDSDSDYPSGDSDYEEI